MSAQIEEWRPVVGFPDYFVSDHGRVRSTHVWRGRHGAILNGCLDRTGYRQVCLRPAGGGKKSVRVHVLVAQAFLGPRPAGHETRHLDGDKLNNQLKNLAYGTCSENNLDKVRHGTHNMARKTHCKRGHAYDAANTLVYRGPRRMGRVCRTCRNEWARAAYHQRKKMRADAAERAE